jgi:molybdate transport system ATP-binding protein
VTSLPHLSLSLACTAGDFSLDARLEISHETVALVGPNGCGKSTLLAAVLGIRTPSRGRIVLGDDVVFDGEAGMDQPAEYRRIAYMPQDSGLFPFMTVRENIEFALACREGTLARKQRRQKAVAGLERFGVAHLAEQLPGSLSGGQRQRVALARAVATRPRAILLDEPTAALDVDARAEVRNLLRSILHALAIPALVVTHDLDDILALAGRIAVMDAGRIVAFTTLAEARRTPPNSFTAKLLAASG